MHVFAARVACEGDLMDGGVLSPLIMSRGVRLPMYLYLLVIPLCDGMLTIKLCLMS